MTIDRAFPDVSRRKGTLIQSQLANRDRRSRRLCTTAAQRSSPFLASAGVAEERFPGSYDIRELDFIIFNYRRDTPRPIDGVCVYVTKQ